MEFTTADLFDVYTDDVQVCDIQFRNFGAKHKYFGQCQTLQVFNDHTPLRAVLGTPGNGRILVVDAQGTVQVGVLGDRLAARAAQNGWNGIIAHGAIRDSGLIESIDIGIKALGTTARKGLKKTEGNIGMRLEFGSAIFEPGNWIYADRDSIIVSNTELNLSLKKEVAY